MCMDSLSAACDSFEFDRVYVDREDFGLTSYSMISPLVQKTSNGQNTMAIFGGPASLDMTNYLLSTMQARGMLAQAAQQLLNSISVNGKREGAVTLSWYKIDCQEEDEITDVLKAASDGATGTCGESQSSIIPSVSSLQHTNDFTLTSIFLQTPM